MSSKKAFPIIFFIAIFSLSFFVFDSPQLGSSYSKVSSSRGIRDYYKALTPEERKDITFIITTLATKSYLSLLGYQGALNQAGQRLDHVHPLKFLGFVFTNPQLKRDVKKINGMPWNRFASDMGNSLKDAYSRNNLTEPFVEDFAKEVKVPYSDIKPAYQNQNWVELINIVRKEVSL